MNLLVPHIDEVKDSLGEAAVQVLSLVFDNSNGIPPSTPSARFRADHPELMDRLDKLAGDGIFLKRDDSHTSYRVSAFALPLIGSLHATQLLECMSTAYEYLKVYYKEHLREPLSVRELIKFSGQNSTLAQEALCYMYDVDGWSAGSSHAFPTDSDSTVIINEQVLTYTSFGNLLARVYEWHYVNPKHKTTATNNWISSTSEGQSHGFFKETNVSNYPAWYKELDDKKKALLIEIDSSLRNDLSALPMMGMRALLESVMVEGVGEGGGFEAKLKRFEENGYVTPQHADVIRKVLDAGHASMHRTYFPSAFDLNICVEVVKHLMHGVYVLHPKVQGLAANTPQRQKSQ
ncbi:MAG: hypothetical protein B7Y56_10835 [Gallionellales bacterium 35-53-114]|jgi:hypothetical protein|nr:MAG: hypothetical protein B7Y56_10835 [Gallionellales bacterium 35-53-114]OYZ64882.1 MAG: hypothetical protein B7Y04_03765 [Gallionellales bacterium 24-53-125]OZB07580.1 MAG: hypothetical protein B7X61_13250 [Gallionellales bacterium 39-52-133]HQS58739.1 DUF4145 domain-containing protein [Gallionellaceae bacterium]HQS75079.1 DUF4145 domain-containing protein [Gallionellaceae bacterium]